MEAWPWQLQQRMTEININQEKSDGCVANIVELHEKQSYFFLFVLQFFKI